MQVLLDNIDFHLFINSHFNGNELITHYSFNFHSLNVCNEKILFEDLLAILAIFMSFVIVVIFGGRGSV